jgi:hypothetical protein
MKKSIHYCILLLTAIVLFDSCASTQKNQYQLTKNYVPDDSSLYKTIVKLDEVFFGNYNNCVEENSLQKYANLYDDDIEFYHDQGGFMNSKKDIVEGTKKNICGKVTRILVSGSIEVYPIKGYGAVEIGIHAFQNKENPPNEPVKFGRFMILWQQKADGWKIKRVVSLH